MTVPRCEPMEIHLFRTPPVNSYVVEEHGRLVVIDVAAGCGELVLRFIESELGRDPHQVSLVVCTHDDPDHIGGLLTVAHACGAEVGVPWFSLRPHLKLLRDPTSPFFRVATGLREALRRRPSSRIARARRTQRVAPDRVAPDRVAPGRTAAKPARRRSAPEVGMARALRLLRPDHRLEHDQTLPGFPSWRVIHSPGHSFDSVCFFHAPSRSLVSGDTVLGSRARGRLVHPAIYANPMILRRTMRRLKQLGPTSVYPGHGSILRGDELFDHLSPD